MTFSRLMAVKLLYAAWLLWAWFEAVPAFFAGARLVSAPTVGLVLFSLIVLGLFLNSKVAWLVSPVPALFVAFFGVPWFVNNVGTWFGYEWYHDSPGPLITVFVGAVLPIPALIALVFLWLERQQVTSLFRRNAPKVI